MKGGVLNEKRKAIHDVNNLMTVIAGNAELSSMCLKDEDFNEIEERLASIIFAVQKASYIIHNLKKPDVSKQL